MITSLDARNELMPHPSAVLARASNSGEQVSALLASIRTIVGVLEARLKAYAASPSHATAERLQLIVADVRQLYGIAMQIGEIVLREAQASRTSLATATQTWPSLRLAEGDAETFRDTSAALLDIFARAEVTVLTVKETAERDLQVLSRYASRQDAPADVVTAFEALIARLRRPV